MEAYEHLKSLFKVDQQFVIEQITQDPKKKKKKKARPSPKDELMISFKPLGVNKQKEIQDSKNVPLPDEHNFTSQCPIRFYDVQIQAIRWMYWIESSRKNNQQVGGILGDDMGLGKTIDALAMVSYDYFCANPSVLYSARPKMPTLIVTVVGVISQWKSEAVKKLRIPENDIMIYHGAKVIFFRKNNSFTRDWKRTKSSDPKVESQR